MALNFITAKGRAASSARYLLFALTFVLFALSIFISGFLGYNTAFAIDFYLICASGLVLLIYLPAALILSLKNSGSRFDQAGGEVAYTVLQALIWLACSIWLLMQIGYEWCNDPDSGFYDEDEDSNCRSVQIGVTVLCLLNLLAHIVWTTWIVMVVHHGSRGAAERKETYKIPTHRLIAGSHANPRLDIASGSQVDLEGQQGLFNPRK